jgi:hypothetical protein
MPTRRFFLIFVLSPVLMALCAVATWAYWTTTGAGTASASSGSINAPTAVAASDTVGSALVAVSWTNSTPAGGLSPTGYYVTRVSNSDDATFDACGSSPSYPTATPPCNDSSVPDGSYHYVVTAVLASWTATSGSSNDVTVSSDVTPPSVTVEQKSGQADPTNMLPMLWTVTFSEPVAGFTNTDLTRGGTSTGGTIAVTGIGATYEIALSGSPTDGSTTFAIEAHKVHDLAGNDNLASTSIDNSITYDTTAPSVTLTTPANGAIANSATPSLNGVAGNATGDAATVVVNIYSGTGTAGSLVQTLNVARSDTAWSTTAAALADGTYTAQASQSDTALNSGTSAANTFTIDTTAPTVTGVSSTLANGSYKTGQAIAVTVTFSEPVTVTGTPQLTLSTGSPASTAVNYTSGSGTSVLTFNYTVAAGNTSPDLDYAATSSLSSNGGTIRDLATNNATLTLASPGSTGSLGANKNLVIDTTAPTVTVTSANGSVRTFPYFTNVNVTSIGGTCGNMPGDSATVSPLINGAATAPATATCTSGVWTLTLTSALTTEASRTLSATQADTAGNTGTATSRTLTIDKTAPTIGISSCTGGNGHRNTVAGTTNDNGSTVSVKIFTGAGTGGTLFTTLTSPTPSAGSWSVTTTSNLLSGGTTYTAQATQIDSAGNTSNQPTCTFSAN